MWVNGVLAPKMTPFPRYIGLGIPPNWVGKICHVPESIHTFTDSTAVSKRLQTARRRCSGTVDSHGSLAERNIVMSRSRGKQRDVGIGSSLDRASVKIGPVPHVLIYARFFIVTCFKEIVCKIGTGLMQCCAE